VSSPRIQISQPVLTNPTFTSASLRHSTLRLTLSLVTHLGSSSLVTYFLRRDLFSSLISFISDDSTKPHAHEAVILIGLLAGHKSDGKNPYATRIQDFVEEGIMTVRPLPPFRRFPSVLTDTIRKCRESLNSSLPLSYTLETTTSRFRTTLLHLSFLPSPRWSSA